LCIFGTHKVSFWHASFPKCVYLALVYRPVKGYARGSKALQFNILNSSLSFDIPFNLIKSTWLTLLPTSETVTVLPDVAATGAMAMMTPVSVRASRHLRIDRQGKW